jgi:hypothetical protein
VVAECVGRAEPDWAGHRVDRFGEHIPRRPRGAHHLFLRCLGKYALGLLAPFIKYWSTPARATKVITNALLNESGGTGVYYDEKGQPMLGSTQVRDPRFQDRVVAETRALLSTDVA